MNLQVNKSSRGFWNNLKLTWQQCADLPGKFWATSVAELDGKMYVSGYCGEGAYDYPLCMTLTRTNGPHYQIYLMGYSV